MVIIILSKLISSNKHRSNTCICDIDSAVLGRFRSAGYNVVDRPRPRAAADDLSVNHSGVVVIAGADVALSPIIIDGVQPTSFESLCLPQHSVTAEQVRRC